MEDTPEVLSHLSIFPRTGELGIITEPPWCRAGPCLPARTSLDLSLLHAVNPTWRALSLLIRRKSAALGSGSKLPHHLGLLGLYDSSRLHIHRALNIMNHERPRWQSTAKHSTSLCWASAALRCAAEPSRRASQGTAQRIVAVSYSAATGCWAVWSWWAKPRSQPMKLRQVQNKYWNSKKS